MTIRDCLVTLNNEAVTVVLFDNVYIQFPAVNKEVTSLKVCFDEGKYFIVDEDTKIEEPAFKEKKSSDKKTTVKLKDKCNTGNIAEL